MHQPLASKRTTSHRFLHPKQRGCTNNSLPTRKRRLSIPQHHRSHPTCRSPCSLYSSRPFHQPNACLRLGNRSTFSIRPTHKFGPRPSLLSLACRLRAAAVARWAVAGEESHTCDASEVCLHCLVLGMRRLSLYRPAPWELHVCASVLVRGLQISVRFDRLVVPKFE
jgi:hypothetical protein